MKKSLSLSLTAALVLGSMLQGIAEACSSVSVQSQNGASQSVAVGLTLDSVPADSLSFTLASGGSHMDTLPVGANSPNPMHLGATVKAGDATGNCSATITNDTLSGLCSGVVDPKYMMTI